MSETSVFLIPGIGGSILANGADPTDRNEVWNARFRTYFDGDQVLPRSNSTEISCRSASSLTSALIPGWLHHFHGSGRSGDGFEGPGWTRAIRRSAIWRRMRVLFSLDFGAESLQPPSAFIQRSEAPLEALGATYDDARVVLIGHSMGGSWLAAATAEDEQRTHTILTLGSPHEAPPKAVAFATSGISVGDSARTRSIASSRRGPGCTTSPTYAGVLDTRTQARVRLQTSSWPDRRPSRARSRCSAIEITAAWQNMPHKGADAGAAGAKGTFTLVGPVAVADRCCRRRRPRAPVQTAHQRPRGRVGGDGIDALADFGFQAT